MMSILEAKRLASALERIERLEAEVASLKANQWAEQIVPRRKPGPKPRRQQEATAA